MYLFLNIIPFLNLCCRSYLIFYVLYDSIRFFSKLYTYLANILYVLCQDVLMGIAFQPFYVVWMWLILSLHKSLTIGVSPPCMRGVCEHCSIVYYCNYLRCVVESAVQMSKCRLENGELNGNNWKQFWNVK